MLICVICNILKKVLVCFFFPCSKLLTSLLCSGFACQHCASSNLDGLYLPGTHSLWTLPWYWFGLLSLLLNRSAVIHKITMSSRWSRRRMESWVWNGLRVLRPDPSTSKLFLPSYHKFNTFNAKKPPQKTKPILQGRVTFSEESRKDQGNLPCLRSWSAWAVNPSGILGGKDSISLKIFSWVNVSEQEEKGKGIPWMSAAVLSQLLKML